MVLQTQEAVAQALRRGLFLSEAEIAAEIVCAECVDQTAMKHSKA